MKNLFIYPIFFVLISCSPSDEKVKDTNSTDNQPSTEQKTTEFSGELKLVVAGETFEYDSMTKSDSRLSFQDKGIAVYIENPNGKGTIAKVVIQSPDIYKSTKHNFWEGSTPREKGMSEAEYQKKKEANRKNILSLKFRRIDNMDEEEYISLDQGSVSLEYDDEAGNFKLTFEGEDKPSYNSNGETIAFSGTLELKGAYLMDSRD